MRSSTYFQAVPSAVSGETGPRSGDFSRLFVIVLAALAFAACGEARLGDPAYLDTDPSPDASPAQPDAFVAPPTPDASVPSTPDASVPDATPAAATCMELYGMAPEYQLCGESPEACGFNAKTDGGNCQEMCAAYGGTCLTAYDNNDDDVCVSQGEDTCLTNRRNEICVCSRPQ